MVRLIALYRQPPDPQAFDAHYRDIHGPLVRTYPGLAGVTVTKLTGLGGQNPVFYQMAEMRFASRADLETALASDAGRASGRDLRNFAQAGVELFVADDGDTLDG